jgi:Protein of unknown function (DUF2911).
MLRQLAIGAFVVELVGCARAQRPASIPLIPATFADSGAFVIRLGRDTLKYERFAINGNHFHSESVRRGAAVECQVVDEHVDADGTVRNLSVSVWSCDQNRQGPIIFTGNLNIVGDSAIFSQGPPNKQTRLRFPGGTQLYAGIGASPIPEITLAPFALIAPSRIGDSVVVAQVQTAFGQRPLTVRRVARDTIGLFNTFLGRMMLAVDSRGRVLSFDGTGGSLPFQGTRLGWIDLDSARQVLADMQKRSIPGNTLSPRDSLIEKIGGANLKIDYGRPSKRGRVIFGSIVRWNQVWRTGANLATHFSTDTDLQIGSTRVPAGTYTLFTIPSQSGWTLIISSETGEWGTDYDPKFDFARIPMQVTTLSSPVEKFTIDIVAIGAQPTLRLLWDTVQASIPIHVK